MQSTPLFYVVHTFHSFRSFFSFSLAFILFYSTSTAHHISNPFNLLAFHSNLIKSAKSFRIVYQKTWNGNRGKCGARKMRAHLTFTWNNSSVCEHIWTVQTEQYINWLSDPFESFNLRKRKFPTNKTQLVFKSKNVWNVLNFRHFNSSMRVSTNAKMIAYKRWEQIADRKNRDMPSSTQQQYWFFLIIGATHTHRTLKK